MIFPRNACFLCALCGKGNMNFWEKMKEMSKKKKLPARNKIALELLHQILGHRSTRSLLAGDTANVCEYIELRIDPYPFCK